jgi:hypothetical protein
VRRLLLAGAAAWALWLGLTLAPAILYDDAAISLRYAERIASGHGFTYNDHERVCGASNPLWTLLIAGGAGTGLDVEQAARLLSLFSFAAVAVLAASVALRLAGPLAACLVGLILPADVVWRAQALSGLELPLAVALGLAAALAVERRREILAGVLLGLAIWNKLDAAALAVALTAAWRVGYGRLPRRMLIVAALVALPWFIFAAAYLGSPWPRSLAVKLQEGRHLPADYFWIARAIVEDRRFLFLVAATFLPLTLRGAPAEPRVVVLALGGWLVLHTLAYSLVNLGDRYPWYFGVPMALSIVLAAGSIDRRWRWSAVTVLAMAVAAAPQWSETASRLAGGRSIELGEAFDADRRLAGVFLDQYAGPHEVVQSGFGWVAFESRRPFMDDTALNSRTAIEPDYIVAHGDPWRTGDHPPERPEGYVELATFDLASRLYPGTTWFTVFGRPSSVAARSGRNETTVDVSRLRDDLLVQAWRRSR